MKREKRLIINGYFDFECDIDKLIENLIELKSTHAGEYTRIFIESDYDYDNSKRYIIYGIRPETPEEEKGRKAKEKSLKQEQEERDRLQFERLKLKFESVNK